MPRYELPNAAPEPLRLVQQFVNTVDAEHGREWWPTQEALAAWLEEHGLPHADLAAALELRSALQGLMLANTGRAVPPDALSALERATARLRVRVDAEGARITGDGALGRVCAVAVEAMLDGSWARLKACRQCGWAFYDYSRNRSATWCSMRICGNRSKTRAYRRRKSGAA